MSFLKDLYYGWLLSTPYGYLAAMEYAKEKSLPDRVSVTDGKFHRTNRRKNGKPVYVYRSKEWEQRMSTMILAQRAAAQGQSALASISARPPCQCRCGYASIATCSPLQAPRCCRRGSTNL